MRAANGFDKSAQLHRLAFALVTQQSIKYQNVVLTQMAIWVPFMLAVKAQASLHIAHAHMSLHDSTKSESTDDFAPGNEASVCNNRCVVSMLLRTLAEYIEDLTWVLVFY